MSSSSLPRSCRRLPSRLSKCRRSHRTGHQRLGDRLRQPQMADQLVDVPIVVSYSSLQQLIAEQIVDIPVPFQALAQDRVQQLLHLTLVLQMTLG